MRAGSAVDRVIEQLLPLLDPGDIIIDGGNSNYQDTVRRTRELTEKGFLYIGTGVSGGEEGALKGPSIMPGVIQKPGHMSKTYSNLSQQRLKTAVPAVIGSEPTVRDTM